MSEPSERAKRLRKKVERCRGALEEHYHEDYRSTPETLLIDKLDAAREAIDSYIAALERVAEAARIAWDDAACDEAGTLYDVPSQKMRALGNALAALDGKEEGKP
jgi:hypothetical protein